MGAETQMASAVHQPERRHRRFSLRYPVYVKFHSGASPAELQAFSKNVSIGGLLLESPAAIPQDCLVTFILRVDGQHTSRPIQLGGEGKVVRVENSSSDGKFAIAVECYRPISELEYLAAS